MWKIAWMIVLAAGMGAFVVTAVLVAVRGLPELKSLLARGRGSGGPDQESESP